MKITPTAWRLGHINAISSPCDTYYVNLANKLYNQIRFRGIDSRFSDFDYSIIATSIAYYFEDVISDLGLWHTFVTTHRELYNKYLPFYEIDETEYYTDEINLDDVRFLLWMGVQQCNENSIINPENPGLTELAYELYSILDSEFEKAPINTTLVEAMLHKRWFTDFFLLKSWCDSIYRCVVMFNSPLEQDHNDNVIEDLEVAFGENKDMALYTASSILSLNSKVGPLAMTVPQWMSRLLKYKGMEREAQVVSSIECLPISSYLVKEYDEELITLESLTGDAYVLARDSFSSLPDETLLTCKTLIVSLARISNGYWQVCGGSSWVEGSRAFHKAQKEHKATKETGQLTYNTIMEANNQHPLLYFADYQEMARWMAQHIGITKNVADTKELEDKRNILLFVETNGVFSFVPEYVLCIKDDKNPYYNKQNAEVNAVSLIFVPEIASSAMIHYLIDHKMLPDARINSVKGTERGRQLVQENIDFMLRFCRGYMY